MHFQTLLYYLQPVAILHVLTWRGRACMPLDSPMCLGPSTRASPPTQSSNRYQQLISLYPDYLILHNK